MKIKKLKYSFGAKMIAVILTMVFIAGCILCAFGIVYLYSNNYYYDSGRSALESSFKEIGDKYAKNIIYNYYPSTLNKSLNGDSDSSVRKYELQYSKEKINLAFALYDSNGTLLLKNYSCSSYLYSSSYENDLTLNNGDTQSMKVEYFVVSPLNAEDEFKNASDVSNFVGSKKATIPILFGVFFILTVLLLVFLVYSIGCRKDESGNEYIALNFIDNIPLDLLVIIELALFFINLLILPRLQYSIASVFISNYFSGYFWCLLIFLFITTLCARCKSGNPLTKTLIFMFFKWLFNPKRNLLMNLRNFANNLPMVWKTILILTAVSVIELIFLLLGNKIELFVFWIIEKIITVPIILICVQNIRILHDGIKKIANGDIDRKIDTKSLMWSFTEYGNELNNINSAMQKVIDERMKSERLRTELITNVSHDIKTPLTSIVTYVDLLKTQDISPESAKQYVDVLDRQSKKLSKLIDDLVDASKASSGNMTVNMEETDAGVMLTQAAAEYDEKLAVAHLTPMVSVPDYPVMINADGQLLWRVFDNLLANICKYSMEDTRVYLSAECIGQKVYITFRNISKCPLNITSEELMERFVRGDNSRNTDGSGLGLSIAQSLIALQNGKLQLHIDGDLFKAVVIFEKSNEIILNNMSTMGEE